MLKFLKHLPAAWILAGILLIAAGAQGFADSGPLKTDIDYARLSDPEKGTVATIWITPKEDWHTYSHNPGEMGKPTRFTARCAGKTLKTFYPPGTVKESTLVPGKKVSIYPGLFPLFVHLPHKLECKEITGTLELLLCSDKRCLPIKKTLSFSLPAGTELPEAEKMDWWEQWKRLSSDKDQDTQKPLPAPQTRSAPAQAAQSYPDFKPSSFSPGLEVKNLGKAIFLALIAGLILNFMPCVLPVISLKLRGMMPSPAAAADLKTQKRGFRHHNLFFALGMLFYFVLLAAIVSYTGMAWGEIFQNSWAIVALSSIVFALSLSLFGVYDLPLIDFKSTPGSSKSPTLEALFTGFLATLLATPCSGPFLGGVLAWALIQPPVTIAAVLLSIGLGMASPYLCLSIFPGLVRFMPRPGKWTRHLENGLGFVLLATTVNLLGLLPEDLILSTLLLFLSIAATAWICGIASAPGVSRAGKGLAALVGAGLVIASLFFLAAGAGPSGEKVWKEFDKENFLARLGKSPVVVEFTAEWCPNCKYLERTVLTDKNIAPLQEKYGIKFFRTDLTREHPQGEALLRKMNSKSIPLLAIFPKHNPHEAIILRDIFTQSELKNALDSALSGEGNTVLD
ncbi:MAG: cytochrome c biogenesis protein CcdA [Desulfovibrionales bacterium]